MLNREKIISHLDSGGVITVSGIWTFTKNRMECWETQEGNHECCLDHYLDSQEAFIAIEDFSDSQEEELDYV